ncbi:MAG: hypothetical protein Q6363_007460, partial [Candidatus Njordarchaeota archaeon]
PALSTPPATSPQPPQPQPTQQESPGGDLFDLDKYLEKLDKLEIPEAPPVEEAPSTPVPEMTPDSGEEGKPVNSDELKKKEKDILKALSELEIA